MEPAQPPNSQESEDGVSAKIARLIPPSPDFTKTLAQEELLTVARKKSSPSVRALESFIRDRGDRVTPKGDDRTNIIDQGERITYEFPDDDMVTLFEHLEALRREGVVTHFSERQGSNKKPTSGIMLDYDLFVGNPEVRVNDRHIHRIACRVVQALWADLVFPEEAVRGGSTGREVTLHVLSIVKPEPVLVDLSETDIELRTKTAYKYGFHILIPGVKVVRGYKKYLLRTLVDDTGILGVLKDLEVLGDCRKCLDDGSVSVPVLFPGSCKRGGTPYLPGPAFEISFEPRGQGSPDFYPMVRSLDAKDYNLVAEMSLCFEARYPNGKDPLIHMWECEYKSEIASQVEDLAFRTQNKVVDQEELLFAEHSLSTLAIHDPEARYLHQILDLLDETYYTDRNKWRDVIFALANTSDTYKPLAEWFSHKCPRKWASGGQDSLDQMWEDVLARKSSVDHPLTKRSIIRWAQTCNPERYRQISEQNYFTILARYVYGYGGTLEHYMVAEILQAMLGNKFIVDVNESGNGKASYTWYEFVVPGQSARPGEVWKWRREAADPDELQLYLSKNLVRVFEQVAEHIEEQREGAETEDQATYYKKLGGAFAGSRRRAFNDGFKNSSIKQAAYLFRRRGFVDLLDQDADIIGVGNGVLRLGATCTLVDHFHEYPITKFTKTIYRPFDPENPWTKLLLGAIADIVPEPDFRDWLLFFAASSLAGGVKEAILLLWSGGGANGKTWFMRMVAKVLGNDYAKKLDISLFTTERKGSGEPDSALMQLKGCRWGYVEETQKAEQMKTQRLKEIVNPGDISASDKHEKQENFEVTANIAVGQNYKFVIDTTDHGTWRRVRHYESKVTFCSNPDPDNLFEKQDDQRFVRQYVKDPDCQAAFFSILVHYYQRLQCEYGGELKRVPCETLDRETERFRNSQDTINRFISEKVVMSPNAHMDYPLTQVSSKYIEWYTVNIDRRRHVASEIIQDLENSALRKCMRTPNKARVLRGCRILTEDQPTPVEGETYFIPAAMDENNEMDMDMYKVKDGWWDSAWINPVPSGADNQRINNVAGLDAGDIFGDNCDDSVFLNRQEKKESVDDFVDAIFEEDIPEASSLFMKPPKFSFDDVFPEGVPDDFMQDDDFD